MADSAWVKRNFEPLPIRARMAFAVACFERATVLLDVTNPAIGHVVEVLWRFPGAEDLSGWEFDLKYAVAPGPAHRATVDGADDQVWEGVSHRLRDLYGHVKAVGRENLYGGTESHVTLEPLARAVQIAVELGVELPDSAALQDSTWDQDRGWGAPLNNARSLLGSQRKPRH